MEVDTGTRTHRAPDAEARSQEGPKQSFWMERGPPPRPPLGCALLFPPVVTRPFLQSGDPRAVEGGEAGAPRDPGVQEPLRLSVCPL